MHKLLKTLHPENGVDAEEDEIGAKSDLDTTEGLEFYRKQYTVERPAAPVLSDPDSWPIAAASAAGEAIPLDTKIMASEAAITQMPIAPSTTIPPCPGGANCVACKLIRQQLDTAKKDWDPDGPGFVQVHQAPCLSTTSAPGPDGMDPRTAIWARSETLSDRKKLRNKICLAETAMFNVWIFKEGRVPNAIAECKTTLLLKRDKAGNKLPADQPGSYRGITMSNVFAKQLSIILARRLTHWAMAKGMFSPEQVGFMPMQGCEDHVLVLSETVRSYWANKPNTRICAVFIDFKKAYDYVQPNALWHILRKMGIPEVLVSFLATWSQQRVTTLTLNGTRSEPWTMRMGVAQGDPLSPLLFNFFMEPLIRRIKADPVFRGVTVEHASDPTKHVNIKLLVYADDVVLLCESEQQATHAVSLVQNWATAWGMELGVGAGKTEAMMFTPPGASPSHTPAPIPIPGTQHAIQWTSEYKYLGFMTRPDLSTEGMIERMLDTVTMNWNRYFYGNPLMRYASPVLALQLYRTCILGSANYLLGLVEPTSAVASMLDAHSKDVIRTALRMPSRTCVEMLWAEGRLPAGLGVMARERVRILCKARLTPLDSSILKAVAAAVSSRNSSGRRSINASPLTSWFHRTEALIKDWQEKYSIPPPAPADANDAPRAAAAFARAVSVLSWQEEAKRTWSKEHPHDPMPVSTIAQDEGSQRAFAAYLNHGYRATAADLGEYKICTPISVRGPGASGGILSYVSKKLSSRQWRILANVRRGREGWANPFGRGDFDAAALKAKKKRSDCTACNQGPNAQEGPFHACCQCTHPQVTQVRQDLIASLPDFIAKLTALGYKALQRPGEDDAFIKEQAQLAKMRAQNMDWSTDDGRDTLFRLLCVDTWSTAHVENITALMLATMFDSLSSKPHRIRPLANAWSTWASTWLLRLHSAYYS